MQAQSSGNKVPKLRFPVFIDMWESRRLGDVAKYRRGSFPQPYGLSKWYDNINGTPFVQVFDVDVNMRLKNKTKQKISKLAETQSVYVEKDSIVLTIQGSIGRIALTQYDAYVDRTLLIFEKFIIPVDKKFLIYAIYLLFEKEKRKAPGGTIKTITKEALSEFRLNLPTVKEQQKIASFLSSVDEWIDNLKNQKEELEEYKKGMMQKIFSQEIRFKDEDGKDFPEWEEKKLYELLDYKQPTNYIVRDTEYGDNYKTPVLTAGKSFVLGYTNETDGIYKDKLPVIIFDDFTTTSQFVDFPFKVKSSAMKILQSKQDVNINFIFATMQLIKYKIGGHGRHWISKYSKLNVHVPSLKEQDKVAYFLTSLDDLIQSKQQKISQAESWKKGLMQRLFV